MELTYIVLIILAVIYIPIWCWVKFSPKAKDYKLSTWGPAVMIRTTWGLELMGKLSKYKRFWRYCGIFSRIVTLLLMVYIVSILVIDLIILPNIIGQKGIGIEYALAIPGINPMLPLVYGWIALIVAMCVHELAHGIQTRANEMDVDSSGVLYGVVPLGAFVEPNEEQLKKANRRAKMDVYAAGITTNFCLALVCFVLMAGAMAGVTVQHGDNAAVYGTSFDADETHLDNTSIILSVEYDHIKIENPTTDQLLDFISEHKCNVYSVGYKFHDTEDFKNIRFGVYVNRVVSDAAASDAGLKEGDYLVSMTVKNDQGDERTSTFGTSTEWSDFIKTTKPGWEFKVSYIRGNDPTPVETAWKHLGDKDGVGYLGISTTNGGYNFITPNAMKESATNPFYGKDTLQGYAMGALSFIGKAFQGYSPVPEATHWWFHSNFLPDDVFWVIVSLLFWIFWLNMVLGVTNALPSVPFDGGFLYAGGLDYLYEKFGVKDEKIRDEKVGRIVSFTSYFMIAVLILVMLVIIF